jgi:iron complex transport system ATP-binding protein
VTAVAVDAVTFRYRSGAGVEAVSFAVAPGERLGIVGPNTAGKSTLIRLLSKVLQPQRGRIQIHGREVATWSRIELARQLAVMPQEFHVAFPFRVGEVVLMGRYPHAQGAWTRRDRETAGAALEALGITPLAHRRIDELSGGERQLVSLARALAQEPSILLLDEPTAHLDIRHQQAILTTMGGAERGRTILLVSHDLNLAAEYCDRLLLLAHGRVVACGSPEEVMTPETLARAYGCAVQVERSASGRPRLCPPPDPTRAPDSTVPLPRR